MGQKIRSILYIDDDDNLRHLLKAALQRNRPDCTVLTFENTGELLAHLMENSADLLLVDYILPEMETSKFLKIVRRLSDIPVIMISGLTYQEMKNLSDISGLIGTVQKPFSTKTVSDDIEYLWRHARP